MHPIRRAILILWFLLTVAICLLLIVQDHQDAGAATVFDGCAPTFVFESPYPGGLSVGSNEELCGLVVTTTTTAKIKRFTSAKKIMRFFGRPSTRVTITRTDEERIPNGYNYEDKFVQVRWQDARTVWVVKKDCVGSSCPARVVAWTKTIR